MKSDLDKHIERQLKDKEFRIYFDKAEAKRILAQEIAPKAFGIHRIRPAV
jgi:hypothetical protein